jgi:hypothetical protein
MDYANEKRQKEVRFRFCHDPFQRLCRALLFRFLPVMLAVSSSTYLHQPQKEKAGTFPLSKSTHLD